MIPSDISICLPNSCYVGAVVTLVATTELAIGDQCDLPVTNDNITQVQSGTRNNIYTNWKCSWNNEVE